MAGNSFYKEAGDLQFPHAGSSLDMDLFGNPLDNSSNNNKNQGDRSASGTAAAAASRQKSCNACVRGKRRCDKSYPRCKRCAARGVDCVYQKVPPTRPSPASVPLTTSTSTTTVSDGLASAPASASSSTMHHEDYFDDRSNISSGSDQEMQHDFDLHGLDFMDIGTGSTSSSSVPNTSTTHTSSTSPATLTLDPGLDFSIADILSQGAGAGGSSIWSMPPFADAKLDLPAPILVPQPQPRREVIRDLAVLSSKQGTPQECMSMNPLLLHDPTSRPGFILNYITNLHVEFARSRALPFIHHRLYHSQLPRTMMAAFSATSAYANRSPSTKAWVYKLVQEAAQEVQRDGEEATTAADKLARVQALVIMETIRMFDGDFTLRVEASKDRRVLVKWYQDLNDTRLEMEAEQRTDQVSARDRPPSSWDSWILLESMRRTCLITAAFMCMLCFLEGKIPPVDLWKNQSNFTASKSLWSASSSLEFYRAWREEPQWQIHDNDFGEFWQFARPEDLDEFTKLLMITQAGTEGVDLFLHGDGGITAR